MKDIKREDLEKLNFEFQNKYNRSEDKVAQLGNKVAVLKEECAKLRGQVKSHVEEIQKLKRYFKSKENEMVHQINNLKNLNYKLKEKCGEAFGRYRNIYLFQFLKSISFLGKYFSKDDNYLKILNQYKSQEEKYKETIEKLEENNKTIVSEVLNLKEQLSVMTYSRNE